MNCACSAAAGKVRVVGLDHAFRIALRDGRRVGVHRVEQKLHGDRTPALQISRVVVGDHHAGIEIAAADRVAQLVDGVVIAGQLEALALGQRRGQIRGSPACGCRR